jgi:3-oxoacyl-[acyl-carrier protein] reductase
MEDLLGLSGQYALVMGGGLGIGRESALLLARAGANVAVVDIDGGRAEAVAKELVDLGVRAIALQGDVRNPLDVQRVVDAAADFAEGKLEILINMIGLASWASVMDIDDETWDNDLNMNLRHHLYVSRAVAKRMIEAGVQGRMAVVASVDAFYASTNHPAYGVAKAGLVSLVKTMAEEWGPYGIRVNAVAPDATLTPRIVASMTDRGIDPTTGPPQTVRPLRRFCTSAEQAAPLIFFVSPLSSYVTGQTLVVDGGLFWVTAGRAPTTMPGASEA